MRARPGRLGLGLSGLQPGQFQGNPDGWLLKQPEEEADVRTQKYAGCVSELPFTHPLLSCHKLFQGSFTDKLKQR